MRILGQPCEFYLQGYDAAFNHFHSTGEMAGYIWHSELCNLDGSDMVVTQVRKAPSWSRSWANCSF